MILLSHSVHLLQVVHEPEDDYINVDAAPALTSDLQNLTSDTSEEETSFTFAQGNFPG